MVNPVKTGTYIDEIALLVWHESGEKAGTFPRDEQFLWLGYAVLVLAKGEETTSRDVHEAWSAWATVRYEGKHRSILPFDDLTPEVQVYDDRYRDAIHAVAAMLRN